MALEAHDPADHMQSAVTTICADIDSRRAVLHNVSREVHSNPELNFKEFRAHNYLSGVLEHHGYVVERQYKDIATAFKAEITSIDFQPPQHGTAVICCEYDALPQIGHACGHNLIAESSIGTFFGLAAAIKAGLIPGRVIIIGTPAEEGGGGKVKLIDAGAFTDIDFALMAHGGPVEIVQPNVVGSTFMRATFIGKAAHAAAGPWEGVNALDACVAAYNSLAMLRQQTQPSNRIHAVILEGGVKANIIPERAVMEMGVRSPILGELHQLFDRVMNIVKLAAESHGCRVEIETSNMSYSPMMHNRVLGNLYGKYQGQFGAVFEQDERVKNSLCYSTDMGNVSQIVPSIHPSFIPCRSAAGVMLHTDKFRDVAGSDAAQEGTIRVAKSMACAAAEVLSNRALLEAVKAEFVQDKQKQM